MPFFVNSSLANDFPWLEVKFEVNGSLKENVKLTTDTKITIVAVSNRYAGNDDNDIVLTSLQFTLSLNDVDGDGEKTILLRDARATTRTLPEAKLSFIPALNGLNKQQIRDNAKLLLFRCTLAQPSGQWPYHFEDRRVELVATLTRHMHDCRTIAMDFHLQTGDGKSVESVPGGTGLAVSPMQELLPGTTLDVNVVIEAKQLEDLKGGKTAEMELSLEAFDFDPKGERNPHFALDSKRTTVELAPGEIFEFEFMADECHSSEKIIPPLLTSGTLSCH